MNTVYKGVAHPWQCDVLGHLTTRYYVGMFDDACYHLIWDVYGWRGCQDAGGKLAWADVRHQIDYVDEVAAGDLLEIRAEITKLGGKSMTARYEMINLGKQTTAATLEAVSVLFDLERRKAVTIGDELRENARIHMLGSDV